MIKVRLNSDWTAKVLQSRGELVIQKDSVATSSAVWFVYPFSAAKSLAPEVMNKIVKKSLIKEIRITLPDTFVVKLKRIAKSRGQTLRELIRESLSEIVWKVSTPYMGRIIL